MLVNSSSSSYPQQQEQKQCRHRRGLGQHCRRQQQWPSETGGSSSSSSTGLLVAYQAAADGRSVTGGKLLSNATKPFQKASVEGSSSSSSSRPCRAVLFKLPPSTRRHVSVKGISDSRSMWHLQTAAAAVSGATMSWAAVRPMYRAAACCCTWIALLAAASKAADQGVWFSFSPDVDVLMAAHLQLLLWRLFAVWLKGFVCNCVTCLSWSDYCPFSHHWTTM